MTDIVERLKNADFTMCREISDEEQWDLMREAADEIERLRVEYDRLQRAYDQLRETYLREQSEYEATDNLLASSPGKPDCWQSGPWAKMGKP